MRVVRAKRARLILRAIAIGAILSGPPATSAQVAATDSAHHQTLPDFVQEALSLYRSAPDSSRVAAILAMWRAAEDSSIDAEPTAISALWRRAGQYRLALEALDAATESGDSRGTVDLERARVLFATGDTDRAAASFWAACDGMSPDTRHELWLDIRGLATPEEQAEWDTLPAVPESCRWVRDFFGERAWRMAMSLDGRVTLHYARLRQARRDYRIRRPRGPADMSDQIGRPPGLEVDDRGLVFLRMGPPHRTASFVGLGAQPNESWAYYGRDVDYIYHFSTVSRMTRPLYGGPLPTPFKGQEVATGESLVGPDVTTALGAVTDVPLSDYRILERLVWVGGDPMLLYQSRAGLGGRSASYASRFLQEKEARRAEAAAPGKIPYMGPEFSHFQQQASQERLDNWSAAEFVIETVPDAPVVERNIRFAHETLRFLNPDDGSASVWLLTSARAGDLEPLEGLETYRYKIALSLAVRTPGGVIERSGSQEIDVPEKLHNEAGISLFIPLRLPAGRHPYTVMVRDGIVSDLPHGNWAQDSLIIPATTPTLPVVSDIAVAADSGGSWTRDGRTFLRVSPTHVTSPTGQAHIYFEVYGVPAGGGYEVDLRVVPEREAKKAYDLPAEQAAFTLRFTDQMPPARAAIGRHHLRLELGDTARGTYAIAVRVRDAESAVESLPSTTLISRQ